MDRKGSLKNRGNKGARKIKIEFYEKRKKRRINIPAIPLGLVEKLILLIFKLLRVCDRNHWANIENQDINEVFKILRTTTPFVLIEVKDWDNEIKIYTL